MFDLSDLKYVLYEAKGGLSLVPKDRAAIPLIDAGIETSVGYQRPSADAG